MGAGTEPGWRVHFGDLRTALRGWARFRGTTTGLRRGSKKLPAIRILSDDEARVSFAKIVISDGLIEHAQPVQQ